MTVVAGWDVGLVVVGNTPLQVSNVNDLQHSRVRG